MKLVTVTIAVALAAAGPASAAIPVDSSALVEAVDAAEIYDYMADLQDIADANDGTRASGTAGYLASVEYIEAQLQAAGYETTRQAFEFEYVEVREAALEQLEPNQVSYVYGEDFLEGFGSPNGEVPDAPVVAVDVLFQTSETSISTSGCEDSDFADFPDGAIALIQRGGCDFVVKVANAEDAGAVGVIIFNEGNNPDDPERTGLVFPNVTGASVPVVGTTFQLGRELVALTDDGLTMRIALDFFSETRTTWNVLAELEGQRDDRVTLVGAHLDSVLEGPGINDNGSGSATILEIAVEMADQEIQPVNTVRFAWWGAEESGLLGAEHYVSLLSKSELKDIAVNLNFDMVASTNYVRFVYDGDAGPVGSGVVEDVFLDWFASQDLPTEPTEFDGRSDYGPFILQGVPAGGLFTGAEGIKTAEQAAIYGGTAGQQYDPCYHAECDTIANVNLEVLEQMADAAAHATMTFAMTSAAVSGTAKGNATGHLDELEFTGPRANR